MASTQLISILVHGQGVWRKIKFWKRFMLPENTPYCIIQHDAYTLVRHHLRQEWDTASASPHRLIYFCHRIVYKLMACGRWYIKKSNLYTPLGERNAVTSKTSRNGQYNKCSCAAMQIDIYVHVHCQFLSVCPLIGKCFFPFPSNTRIILLAATLPFTCFAYQVIRLPLISFQ